MRVVALLAALVIAGTAISASFPGPQPIAVTVRTWDKGSTFILPGDCVAVICTITDKKLGVGVGPRTVLRDLPVLAVEPDTTPEGTGAVKVTLKATPEEAGRLKLASSLGEIRLIILPP
jgi:Flp pilus assembly protein CpaB